METKMKKAVYDGAVNFVANSMLQCFDYKAIKVKEKENNFFEVYIPIDFEKIHISEEKFFAYLDVDLHYLPLMFGEEIIDTEIVTLHGLYYKVNNKIAAYMSDIAFDKNEKIIFSLMEENDLSGDLIYETICTIQIIFQSNEI